MLPLLGSIYGAFVYTSGGADSQQDKHYPWIGFGLLLNTADA